MREGTDVTLVTYGALVQRSLVAARQQARRRGSTSRSSTCARSPVRLGGDRRERARRPAASIVAHEDSLSWGFGAEIAARIAAELFEYLDAPVRRVGALDTFVGYAPLLEDAILPQVSTLAKAMREPSRY